MALSVDPGMIVVREQGERKPGLLRAAGQVDQLARPMLLTRQRVADLSHQSLTLWRSRIALCPRAPKKWSQAAYHATGAPRRWPAHGSASSQRVPASPKRLARGVVR